MLRQSQTSRLFCVVVVLKLWYRWAHRFDNLNDSCSAVDSSLALRSLLKTKSKLNIFILLLCKLIALKWKRRGIDFGGYKIIY